MVYVARNGNGEWRTACSNRIRNIMDYEKASMNVIKTIKSGDKEKIAESITTILYSRSVDLYSEEKKKLSKTLFNPKEK